MAIRLPEEIQRPIIREWLSVMEDVGLKKSTRDRKLSSLKQFLIYLAHEERMLLNNPAEGLHAGKRETRLPTVVEEEKVLEMLDIVQEGGPAH